MHSCVKGKQDCSTNTKQRQKTHVKHRITSINTRQKSINTFYGEHDWYTLTGHFVGNTVLVPSWILFCLQNMMEPSLDDVYTIFWPYHPNVAAEIGKIFPNLLSKFFNLLFIYFGEHVWILALASCSDRNCTRCGLLLLYPSVPRFDVICRIFRDDLLVVTSAYLHYQLEVVCLFSSGQRTAASWIFSLSQNSLSSFNNYAMIKIT